MNLEDFQLIDNEPIDDSIVKRDYTKVYHQQAANLNDSNQSVEFIFGENNTYYQIGNAYLELDITIRKVVIPPADPNFANADQIRLINNAFVIVLLKLIFLQLEVWIWKILKMLVKSPQLCVY